VVVAATATVGGDCCSSKSGHAIAELEAIDCAVVEWGALEHNSVDYEMPIEYVAAVTWTVTGERRIDSRGEDAEAAALCCERIGIEIAY